MIAIISPGLLLSLPCNGDVVDDSLVRELEKDGFIDRVYG
jgi:hypothetical protein